MNNANFTDINFCSGVFLPYNTFQIRRPSYAVPTGQYNIMSGLVLDSQHVVEKKPIPKLETKIISPIKIKEPNWDNGFNVL